MHLRQVVMSCVQHKRRAAARERRANETSERQRKRARRATSGVIGPDDASDASPPPVKRGRPTKDDALVRRLANKAGVRPEIIIATDRVIYIDEEEQDEYRSEDRSEDYE
jgi:hypothetical protein